MVCRSKVWRLSRFTTPERAEVQCDLCPTKIKYVGNTTNIARHLEMKHPIEYAALVLNADTINSTYTSGGFPVKVDLEQHRIQKEKEDLAIKKILQHHNMELKKLRDKQGSTPGSHKKYNNGQRLLKSLPIRNWSWHCPSYENKVGVAGNSSYGGYSDNVSGGENAHCDDVSVDLSPGQILGDDGDLSRTSASPPAQRPESFKLSHNNHLSIVLDSLASDESFMDVTLTAQGKSIKAHKSVLSAVSPYFKSVLRENPCQHPIIIMPRDITFEQLKNIIAYVYKGEMTVAASELSNLLKTAELLQVSGLSPSETGSNAFNDESVAASPQQTPLGKWMDDSSPVQRLVKTPVKTAKSSSKKRPRTSSRENSPSAKRTTTAQDPVNEITCVKEEIPSGNEFEETDYPPGNSGIDDPGENSVSFSDESDIEERSETKDPLLLPKTESTSATVFECAYCEKSFSDKQQQDDHIKTSHPTKKICVCSCGKSFETPVDLEDHKQSCLMI